MSGKVAKQIRNKEKAIEAEYMGRLEIFNKEIQELSRKYMIDMVGALQYKQTALIPVIAMVDAKDKYGHVVEPSKTPVEPEIKEELKPQAQKEEIEKSETPKLEI